MYVLSTNTHWPIGKFLFLIQCQILGIQSMIYVTIVYSLQVTTFKRCTLLLNMVFSQTQQGNTGELGSQFNCFNNLASF